MEEARNILKGPAIAILVIAILGALFLPLSIVGQLTNMAQIAEQSNVEQSAAYQMGQMIGYAMAYGLSFIFSILAFIGALKMQNPENRGWGYIASIVMLIPSIANCCIIGIPFGIWGLVAL
ncbi:MAG: hypothetical protein KDK34_23560, partial [Leptospiraceae bacterium]|nr:hypothetical protein [Leptospiraceae bacterium]